MTLADFPALNATLNGLSTVFIATGWTLIRAQRQVAHAVCMILATITSSVFLSCYLYYHFTLHGMSIHFTYPGVVKWVYYVLLLTHVLLAFTVPPLVISTLVPALRRRWASHRRMGRWTMPIWLYVSVTGVIVYMMLYQWFPSDEIKTKLGPQSRAQAGVAARRS